jgi:hypothetical protein
MPKGVRSSAGSPCTAAHTHARLRDHGGPGSWRGIISRREPNAEYARLVVAPVRAVPGRRSASYGSWAVGGNHGAARQAARVLGVPRGGSFCALGIALATRGVASAGSDLSQFGRRPRWLDAVLAEQVTQGGELAVQPRGFRDSGLATHANCQLRCRLAATASWALAALASLRGGFATLDPASTRMDSGTCEQDGRERRVHQTQDRSRLAVPETSTSAKFHHVTGWPAG